MSGLHIGVIGGGSSYTPELIDGIIRRSDELAVDQITLMDIAPERLDIVGGLARRMIERAGLSWDVLLTGDQSQALDGVDFVITQMRQGGLEARALDESIPKKYGLIGQETTGPGGFAMALRTVPVLLEIAHEIERRSPDAFLINFTNPSGLVTEALNQHSGVKILGLCNVPIGVQKRLAAYLGVDSDRLFVDSFGLNHLSWVRGVQLDGEDITEELFAKVLESPPEDLEGMFNMDFLRALKLIPGYYLEYYYEKDRLTEKQSGQALTRAQEVMKIDEELMALYADTELDEKPAILEQRGGAWYSDAAISLLSAIVNDKNEMHVVNIPNAGTMSGLPHDAVAEIPAIIGKDGARPLHEIDTPLSVVGLIQSAKAYELLTIEAALSGDRDDALIALFNNPLVDDIDVAVALLDDILEANRPWLPQFHR